MFCASLKRKNAVIYSILLISKSWNMSENVSKRRFFPFLGTLKTGGNALGDAYERPGFRPKSSPPAEWRIFVFCRLASEGRWFGARLTIEL